MILINKPKEPDKKRKKSNRIRITKKDLLNIHMAMVFWLEREQRLPNVYHTSYPFHNFSLSSLFQSLRTSEKAPIITIMRFFLGFFYLRFGPVESEEKFM